MLIRISPDAIPFGATPERPASRYAWLVHWEEGVIPHFEVMERHPEDSPFVRIHPRIHMPPEFMLAAGVTRCALGWSADGHHWVIFGLDNANPIHRTVVSTSFQHILEAIAREGEAVDLKSQKLLSSMRHAWRASS